MRSDLLKEVSVTCENAGFITAFLTLSDAFSSFYSSKMSNCEEDLQRRESGQPEKGCPLSLLGLRLICEEKSKQD